MLNAAQIGLACVGCKFNTSLCPAPSICGKQADGMQGDGCGSDGPDDDCPVPGTGGTPCTITDTCIH